VPVFAAAALVILCRSLDAFIHPVSGWEDATQGLNFYSSDDAGVLHFYAGYVSVLPNVVDYLAVRWLPLVCVPAIQAWFALLVASSVAPATFGFLRNALVWPRRRTILAAVLVAVLPWGDVAAVSNTEYSIWAMLAVTLLTLFNPVPDHRTGAAGYLLWRMLFLSSNPVCAVAAPFWLGLAVVRRHKPNAVVVYMLLVATTIVYVRFGVGHGPTPAFHLNRVPTILDTALRLATEKSLLVLVLRDVLRTNLSALGIPTLLGLLLGTSMLIAFLHAYGRRDIMRAVAEIGIVLGWIALISLACAFGRGTGNGEAFVLASPRYHYVPQILWLLLMAIFASDVYRVAAQSRRRRRILGIAVLACIFLMWQKGTKSYRSDNAVQSRAIAVFLATADANAKIGKHEYGRFGRVGHDSDWSIVIGGDRQRGD